MLAKYARAIPTGVPGIIKPELIRCGPIVVAFPALMRAANVKTAKP